jgi:7-cyano-7-deazaguanine synthase
MTQSALVLFSGGQDSTVCLAWTLEHFDHVETIGFDYRQRHRIELECRTEVREALGREFPAWSSKLGDDYLLDLSILSRVSETALTRDTEISLRANGLPNTFVPGRNLLFFTLAASIAYRRDIKHLVGGMCETDFSGYPDCRDDTLKAVQIAINLGMDRRFTIHTPLMWIDKAATWQLARKLGGDCLVSLVVDKTHTCYVGQRGEYHAWGYGCGNCPACKLRAAGFLKFTTQLVDDVSEGVGAGA